MKKEFKYLTFLLLFVPFLIACYNRKDDTEKVFKLEKRCFSEWTEIISVKDTVTLHSTDSSIITYADKCKMYDGNIYFWDHKLKKVYCFSRKGEIIRTIGAIGRSASEYIGIKDMWIDGKEKLLKILEERSIICYSLKNGKYIRCQKLYSDDPNEYERFAVVGRDSVICFTDNRNKNSIVLDTHNGTKGLRESKRFHFVTSMFYFFNEECRVLGDYGELKIDRYLDGKLKPLYRLDLGDDVLPDNVLPRTFDEFNNVDNDPKYFKCIVEAYETNDWLYVVLVGPNMTYYYGFINKESGKYYFGKDFSIVVTGADKDTFYGLVYPEYISKESPFVKYINPKVSSIDPVFIRFKITK